MQKGEGCGDEDVSVPGQTYGDVLVGREVFNVDVSRKRLGGRMHPSTEQIETVAAAPVVTSVPVIQCR